MVTGDAQRDRHSIRREVLDGRCALRRASSVYVWPLRAPRSAIATVTTQSSYLRDGARLGQDSYATSTTLGNSMCEIGTGGTGMGRGERSRPPVMRASRDCVAMMCLMVVVLLVGCTTTGAGSAGGDGRGAAADEGEPCGGREDAALVEPWREDRSSCHWRLHPHESCGGVVPPAPQAPPTCVCHECQSDADCTSKPQGRCIDSALTDTVCSPTQLVCVYPEDRCYDCGEEAICVRDSSHGPYCHVFEQRDSAIP